MGIGPQGPQGLPGNQGEPGESVVVDKNQVTTILNNQTTLLNRLSSNIANNTNVINSINDQILKSTDSISNTLAGNINFQNNIGNNIVQNSTTIGDKIADNIISNNDNIQKLTSSFSSQGTLIDDLAYTLSSPTLPYYKYLQGQPGSITTIKSAIKPYTMLCDTVGNCITPKTDYYLNFTNGNLVFNNKENSPSFSISNDGGPWITGNKGGILGTYNDNLNVGSVALKWDAQGNVSISDLAKTTGSLRVGGDMYLKHLYASGFLTAINTININTTDGSSYVEGIFHVGTPGYNRGLTGTTDGSTFNITKNGPYKTTNGGNNVVLFNNYNNPYIFGDTTTSGNIYMLNNNENIGNIPGGENWSKKITGSSDVNKKNSAIINNTGKMEDIKGSLMLIGNAVGNNTNRTVTIKDKLRIGSWILSETPEGKLEIKNMKNPNDKLTIDDILDIQSNRINNINFRGSTIGSNNINNGNISTSNLNGINLISNNIKGKDYNSSNEVSITNIEINGNIRGQRFESNSRLFADKINSNSLQGGPIFANKVNCRDAVVDNTIRSYNSDIMLRANNVKAADMITKWGGSSWLCEQSSYDDIGRKTCKRCGIKVCHGNHN